MKNIIILAPALAFFFTIPAFADQIYLNNGDRLTGHVTEVSKEEVKFETASAGTIAIKRESISRTEPENLLATKETEAEIHAHPKWTGEASAGYNKANGNTKSSQANAGFKANLKTDHDEWTFKSDGNYTSQDRKMNGQKYYGMARYAYSFGAMKKWYHFFKMEADHDRFADIDYRLIPNTGIGYWFSDQPDWKLMTEAGVGLSHTKFRSGLKDADEIVVVPRLFAERKIFGKIKISEDLTLYPSIDTGKVRLRSESIAEYPLSQRLASRLSFIEEYNSGALDDVKKTDWRLVSSLVYSF